MKWRLIPFILILLLVGCVKTNQSKDTTVIPAIKTPPKNATNPVRRTAVQEAALSFGAQAGLAWRSQKINKSLLRETASLNKIFDFNALILKNNVLPPVLVEGDYALNLDNYRAVRLSDKVYKIEQPPRFVTTPPTWREYLWLDYKTPEQPNQSVLPKNQEERDIWNKYIKIGWQAGVDQANQIFSINLGRLKRDYSGMVLYRKLLAQHMVTPPFVAKVNLGVTGDDNMMRINDQVLRITATSKLNRNAKEWKSVITKGEVDELKNEVDKP